MVRLRDPVGRRRGDRAGRRPDAVVDREVPARRAALERAAGRVSRVAREGIPAVRVRDRGWPRHAAGRGERAVRVLVAYGSRRGGTAEIAARIAGVLRDRGFEVDCARAASIGAVSRYDAVILGGGLYASRWVREARRFVARHATALRAREVWMFSSGPLDDAARGGDVAATRQVAGLMAKIGARGHRDLRRPADPGREGLSGVGDGEDPRRRLARLGSGPRLGWHGGGRDPGGAATPCGGARGARARARAPGGAVPPGRGHRGRRRRLAGRATGRRAAAAAAGRARARAVRELPGARPAAVDRGRRRQPDRGRARRARLPRARPPPGSPGARSCSGGSSPRWSCCAPRTGCSSRTSRSPPRS